MSQSTRRESYGTLASGAYVNHTGPSALVIRQSNAAGTTKNQASSMLNLGLHEQS